ncbi:hypothetical protein BS17DRAFT_786804 [Gyrodon lividus]|nr:hypothetical protein BS17DRAFT_786804 [Gyrodon lividus]
MDLFLSYFRPFASLTPKTIFSVLEAYRRLRRGQLNTATIPKVDFLTQPGDFLVQEFLTQQQGPQKDIVCSLSEARQSLQDAFDQYVFNDIPAHLLRTSDMRIVTREEIWETFRCKIEAIEDADIEQWREISRRKLLVSWCTHEELMTQWCQTTILQHLKYAIFSHRWGIGEPLFYEMSSKRYGQKPTPDGLGYKKLVRFCEKAAEYGCSYVWSDTCCINKESSSELEEAIRSMYRWYRDAEVCIVYLAQSSSLEDFGTEPWFTRGWTLQELLAPRRMRFYGKEWTPICPEGEGVRAEHCGESGEEDVESLPLHLPNDKKNRIMLDAISKVTEISPERIQHFLPSCVHLAETMRWASKRKTTRIEDIAYSLMGIFHVSMPIAYGEGDRAFYRLLEEIVQRCRVSDFFAWAGKASPYSYAFPSSPASYGRLDPEIARQLITVSNGDSSYANTKSGVRLKALVVPVDFRLNPSDSDSHADYTLEPIATIQPLQAILDFIDRYPVRFPTEDRVLAIINYKRVDEGHGALRVGELYFCLWLLKKAGSIRNYTILDTDRVLTLCCKEDVERQLEDVCLLHHPH